MTAAEQCTRCEGKRKVYNAALKRRIRCPRCTVRRRSNPAAMREFVAHDRKTISAPEQARMIERVERSLREAIDNTLRSQEVPEHLVTTHRVLQRWAAEGTGAPAENPDVYHESRPPPLPPDTYAVVESVIARAPRVLRSLTRAWYRTQASTKQLADRRGMSVRSLGRRYEDCLVYARAGFLDSGHADLVAMIRMQV